MAPPLATPLVLLQERVYHSRICDVDLKERLIEKWRRFIKASLIVHYSRAGSTSSLCPYEWGPL
jgi:hypothetical protein